MATKFAPAPLSPKRYEEDAYGWALEQAALLRARTTAGLDWDNLAEEIDSVGRSERKEIENRLERVIEHLMKLAVCLDDDPRAGWWETFEEQRARIEMTLSENPSLRPRSPDLFATVWRFGAKAARDGLSRSEERARVPQTPCLTYEQAMTVATDEELRAFLPR